MRMRSPTATAALVCLGLVHGSVHPRPTVLPRASTLRVTSPSSSRRAILGAATVSRCVEASRPPNGHFALQHAPPAPDQAQGVPASANRQRCSGWPATSALFPTQAAAAATCAAPPAAHAAVGQAKEVLLTTSASGLKWGDIRPGVGNVPGPGQTVTIDYMMTKRAGAKIHSTKDARQPFTWTIGDGTVIEGLEIAILGGGGVPPMLPGGIRRVMRTPTLALTPHPNPNPNSYPHANPDPDPNPNPNPNPTPNQARDGASDPRLRQ